MTTDVPTAFVPPTAGAVVGTGSSTLIAWVLHRRPQDVPARTLRRTGTALLHHALCGARGQTHPAARAVRAAVPGDAAEDVAYRDAVAGHSTLQEDMHVPSVSHLGTVVWPTALALAADDPTLTVERLLTAATVGYEVGGAVGAAVSPQGLPARARPTGTFGPVASWAVAATLLRPDARIAASALGLAANAAAGLNGWAWQGGEEVYVHSGQAASAGIRSVRLAVAGVQGSPDVLFGRQGYLRTLGGDRAAEAFAGWTLPGPGGDWVVDDLVFKGHPACNYTQTVIDAVGTCPPASRPADGTTVEVRVTSAAAAYPGCDGPPPWPTLLSAQMSIQFAVAAAFEPDGYTAVLAAGPRRWMALEDLGRRTFVVADPGLDQRYPAQQGAHVTYTAEGGSRVDLALDDLQGLTDARVREQLREVGAGVDADDVVTALVSAVDGASSEGGSAARVAGLVHELWAAAAAA